MSSATIESKKVVGAKQKFGATNAETYSTNWEAEAQNSVCVSMINPLFLSIFLHYAKLESLSNSNSKFKPLYNPSSQESPSSKLATDTKIAPKLGDSNSTHLELQKLNLSSTLLTLWMQFPDARQHAKPKKEY